MDTEDEALGYDQMDHSQVNRVFISDFRAVWNGRSPIIDLGTGTAQIPIEFCRQAPQGNIIALDAAAHMLRVATANVANAGYTARITLQLVDAKGLPFADHSIAAVMSNSIIHHIPTPLTVFREIARVVAPGATIFVRDLFRPADHATLDNLVRTYAGAATAHQQRMFAESLHAALTLAEVQTLVQEVGFDPRGVTQTTDRHWTWSTTV
jgi:ubiquinone/menaquinone biosynthesis C-methylase UbiE